MRENEKAFLSFCKQDVYKVYKNGKIYKCKRKVNLKNEYKNCKSRLMDGTINNGYIRISFIYGKKIMHILAHRLIWLYFNDDIIEGLEPNHKNGVKNDNRLSNLELITRSEQMIHAVNVLGRKIGNFTSGKDKKGGSHKLTEKKVLRIRKLLKEGLSQYKIAEMFDISRGAIEGIDNGKNWAWLV